MLKPRVGLVQVVHLDRGLKKCQKREEGIKNTLHTTDWIWLGTISYRELGTWSRRTNYRVFWQTLNTSPEERSSPGYDVVTVIVCAYIHSISYPARRACTISYYHSDEGLKLSGSPVVREGRRVFAVGVWIANSASGQTANSITSGAHDGQAPTDALIMKVEPTAPESDSELLSAPDPCDNERLWTEFIAP